MLRILNIEIEFEILKILRNTLILSPVKQKFTSPIPPCPVTEILHYTGNKLALTPVKCIFCIPEDVMCQLMALPPSQLREMYHLSPLSAGQLSPSHFRENHRVSSEHPQKGFYCKKGSLSSASPGIQMHISNSGETTLHVIYLDCKPLEEQLTLPP